MSIKNSKPSVLLSDAVRVLMGEEEITKKLKCAYEEYIVSLEENEIPDEYKSEALSLKSKLSSINKEGFENISTDEAISLSDEILSLYVSSECYYRKA